MKTQLLITCEHASHTVPKVYESLIPKNILMTHRGWDIGAYCFFKQLTKKFPCYSLNGACSRLVVDLNRSLSNPHLFSEFMKPLSAKEKEKIIRQYYSPYRETIESSVEKAIHAKSRVIHLSIHSFTPQLGKSIRQNDIGLLYDSRRWHEKQWCDRWRTLLLEASPQLIVRRNYPYLGRSDGMTCHLRKRWNSPSYLGIELEINQKHFNSQGRWVSDLEKPLLRSLAHLLSERAR